MEMIEITGCDPFPRRNRVDLMTAEELAIFSTMRMIEKSGTDPLLTEAVTLLERARHLLADYIERR